MEQMVELQAVVAWISHTVHSHDQPTSWAVQNEPQDIRNHLLSTLPKQRSKGIPRKEQRQMLE